MPTATEFTTNSAEETVALGRQLAHELKPPQVILLRGDLGAGKTTIVKGLVEGMSASGEENVTSPTFTLVHEYRSPAADIFHIDLYRIDTSRELQSLGIDDLLSDRSVLLIEWGEKFERFRKERDIEISITSMGDNRRRIRIDR